MIVKARRGSKLNQKGGIDDHYLRRALALLPSASSEAWRRLRRRTMVAWDVHCFQKGSVFNGTQGIVFHMFQDVILVSVPWLHSCLP
jgi:hypothetical protein